MKTSPRRFGALIALLAAGILAGTQLGKIAPLVPWYREAGYSLVTIGWLTAALGIFVALAALPVAFAIERAGLFRSFLWSATVLVAGGIALAFFEAPSAVLAARLAEAAGYLVLVIAIPAILTSYAPGFLKGPALAIWGGFVPIGFAVADFLARAVVPGFGGQAFLYAAALAFALTALVAAALTAGLSPWETPRGRSERVPVVESISLAAVLLGASFGMFVVLSLGLFTFLPTLVARSDLLMSAGAIALLVPAGNILTGILMRGRGLRFAVGLGVSAYVVCAACTPLLAAAGAPGLATMAAALLAAATGVVASTIFASVPFVVPPGGSPSVVIGVIAQAGGIGTLAGPPLAGFVLERGGWQGFGWLLALVSVLGLLLLLPLLGRAKTPHPAG